MHVLAFFQGKAQTGGSRDVLSKYKVAILYGRINLFILYHLGDQLLAISTVALSKLGGMSWSLHQSFHSENRRE